MALGEVKDLHFQDCPALRATICYGTLITTLPTCAFDSR